MPPIHTALKCPTRGWHLLPPFAVCIPLSWNLCGRRSPLPGTRVPCPAFGTQRQSDPEPPLAILHSNWRMVRGGLVIGCFFPSEKSYILWSQTSWYFYYHQGIFHLLIHWADNFKSSTEPHHLDGFSFANVTYCILNDLVAFSSEIYFPKGRPWLPPYAVILIIPSDIMSLYLTCTPPCIHHAPPPVFPVSNRRVFSPSSDGFFFHQAPPPKKMAQR